MVDSKRDGAAAGGGSGSIPARVRETMQNLKEIVDCTDQEIYAMLKECNMDLNEAVHRLLTQGTFHEVKNKREKKKETKGIAESRSQRVSSSSSSHGVRGGTDRAGRNGSTQISSYDHGVTCKPVHKKDNGENIIPTSSILGSGMAVSNSNRSSPPLSNYDSVGNTIQSNGVAESIYFPSPPLSTVQHNWSGGSGQLSMADIVRMGRPQAKPSSIPVVATEIYDSYTPHHAVMPNTMQAGANCFSLTVSSESNQELHSSQDRDSKVTEISHEPSTVVSQHKHPDEWPLIDQSLTGNGPNILEACGSSSIHPDLPASSSLQVDGIDLHQSPHLGDIQVLGHDNGGSLLTKSIKSGSVSVRQLRVDCPVGDLLLDEGDLKNTSYDQPQRHPNEQLEVEDVHREVLSAAVNLQQLTLCREQSTTSSANNPSVIIPRHLQVANADCSHLSFGNFGSGVTVSLPGSSTSISLKNNLGVTSITDNALPVDRSDARKPEYFNNEQLRSASDYNVPLRTGRSSDDCPMASASQPEADRYNAFDATQRPPVSGYSFSSTTQSNDAAYTHIQANYQMQNLASLSSLMQPYSDSVRSNLFTEAAQTLHELDHPLLPLLLNQSMPTKYSNSESSLIGPTISMAEASEPRLLSTLWPASHTTSVPSIPAGHAPPQYLPDHLANMTTSAVLPQSIPYMPFSGSSAFHQSPTALHSAGVKYMLPQIKSRISLNSLPCSAPFASDHGGFRSSTIIPGRFTHNPSTIASTAVGYEELLGLQYKGGHLIPLHQNENSLMWLHGAETPTTSAVPDSSYYLFNGQNQHGGGVHRQVQQPTNMEMHTNCYRSESGVSWEQHQQQHFSQGNLHGLQG